MLRLFGKITMGLLKIKQFLFSASGWKQIILIILAVSLFMLPLQAHAEIDFGKIVRVGSVGLTALSCIFAGPLSIACAVGFAGSVLINYLAGGGVFSDIIKAFATIMVFVGNFVVGKLLYAAGLLLRVGLEFNMQRISDEGVVISAAAFVKSIANLVLIAILIIIALATIVGIESYGIRKTLPLLIGLALIVNFSTVLVGLPVDAGNTLMKFFWDHSNLRSQDLGTYIFRNMEISKTLITSPDLIGDPSKTAGSDKDTDRALAQAGISLIIILLGLLASYVFLRLAVLFILRVGIFWILIMTAPLVFILGAIPIGRNYLKDWWKQLFNWAFLGPIVFFFLFFGLILWTTLNERVIANSSTSISSSLLTFPLIALFFLYALNVSKKMAGAAANAVVDSVISLGKGVALGGLALAGGAVLAGAGGRLLRRPGVKRAYEALQRRRSPALQATGRRLEAAHGKAVEEEEKRAKGLYSGLDALSSTDLANRWKTFTPRQKVTAAGILEERKETFPQGIAAEALALAPGINKEVEKRLKRSAFHARYFSTEPRYAKTGNIRIADAYNYMVTNGIRGVNWAPQALETPALAGLLDYRQLTEIARRGTFQQLQAAIKGIEELAKTENIPMQLAIASELRKDPGAYQKALEGLTDRIKKEAIFSAGRTGEYVAPLDISGGAGSATT